MSESIGPALRTGRLQRHLTLEQVSESTRIRIHYLRALENGDLSAIPSAAQARGFLRLYAQFLDLDLEALIPAPAADPATSAPAGSTQDASGAPPASPTSPTLIQPGQARTGLLSSLRDRLARRLSPNRAAEDAGTPTKSTLEPDSDGKKKAFR